MATQQRLKEALVNLKVHDHLCLIYETPEEQFAAAVPFIKIGLDRNEKCFYIADDNTVESVLSAMKEYGVDVTTELSKGRLTVATKRDAYLKEGYFDPAFMIEFLKSETQKAKDEGYSALRVTGEMTWALGGDPGSERLIEYENLLNTFFPANDCLAICQYNRKRFSPEIIIDVIRTHPIVIYREAIVRNYFFEPPEEAAGSPASEDKLRRMLSAINDWEGFEKISGDEQAKHKMAFELNPGALSISTFDKGVFLEVNDNFVKILGYDEDEIVGKSVFDLGFWAETEKALKLRELLRSNRVVRNFEFQSKRKDGSRRWLLLSAMLVNYQNRECIFQQSFDINERKLTEDALAKSEAHVRSILESAGEGIYGTDDKNICTFINPTALKMLKYERSDEVIGKEMHSLTHHSHADGTPFERTECRISKSLETGEEVRADDYCFWRKDGSSFPIEFHASPQFDNGHIVGSVVTFTDITERRLAEDALKKANRDWEETFNATPDPIMLLDGRHRVLRVNKSFTKRLGIEPENAIGKYCYEIVHETTEPPSFCPHVRTMADGKEHSVEVEHTGAKGTFIVSTAPVFGDGGELKGSVHVMHEITESKAFEEKLKKSERKYRELIELAQEGIWTIDNNAVTTFVNPRMADMLGYTVDEMLGRHLFSFMDEQGVKLAQTLFERRREGITESHDFEFMRKDGIRIYARLEATPLKDDSGEFSGALAVVADVTELRASEEKMRQVQKLESLGVLAGGIAHDFNNLLMVILGNIDMSLLTIPKDTPAARNLRSAEKACQNAADLTKQMLAYAGKGQFFIEQINFREIIDDIDMVIPLSISKKVSIKYDLKEKIPYINADPGQIKQILMNLVTNASEAIGDNNGEIRVSIGSIEFSQNDEKPGRVFLSENLNDREYVFVEVSDTGCGIDGETIPKIFDPFFTTKFIGRGLGLAAVMGIVRSLNGAISVRSEQGRGSVFTLYLPVPSDINEARGSTEALTVKTVLLVDDEEDVLATGEQMLARLGYRVLVARNGREAVEAVRMHSEPGSEKISLILLDIGMPVMNGNEAYDEIVRIDPEIPIFISSGYGEDDVVKIFEGRKTAGMLHKPYKVNALEKALNEYFK